MAKSAFSALSSLLSYNKRSPSSNPNSSSGIAPFISILHLVPAEIVQAWDRLDEGAGSRFSQGEAMQLVKKQKPRGGFEVPAPDAKNNSQASTVLEPAGSLSSRVAGVVCGIPVPVAF
jgi:hypothetical protein